MTGIAICLVVSPYIKFKILHTIAAVMVMGCSLLFAKFPAYRGFFQRLMYMGSFLWLIFMYSTNL
ncbi:hypothetical protein HMPREF1982_02977 [Clostridiales bacterium oral taxon 876 str. F0540]|nr:hypothetical protein HMPREF1982_02977 [Clostridiales bacterium oral taxon 876 str. F0540]